MNTLFTSFVRSVSSPADRVDLHLSRCLTACGALVLLVGLIPVERGLAQNAAAKVVSMETGVQHEGEVFAIPDYKVGMSAFPAFSSNPIIVIDDGLRRIFVNRTRTVDGLGASLRNEIPIEIPQRVFDGSVGGGTLLRAGPFNEYGHREFTVNEGGTVRQFVQGITQISPRWCEINTLVGADGVPRQWRMKVATRTVPKSVIRNLLLGQITTDNPNDYYDIVDFFRQTSDFEQANAELALIETRFPDQKERVDDLRIELNQLYGRQILKEINTRIDAGQPRLALGLAEAMNERMASLSFDIRAQFQAIKDQRAEVQTRLDETRQQVFELLGRVQNLQPAQVEAVRRFQQELETELNEYNSARLDAFFNLAKDRSIPDSNKVSLALSGWVLGSNNAIPNLAIAEEMFAVRDLVYEYLSRETTPERREQILQSLAGFESGTPEYIAAMVKLAKPIDAADLAGYTGEAPIEFMVEVPGTPAGPGPWQYRCAVHLPPEYNPYRDYPLILSLPDVTRPLESSLNIWCGGYNRALSEGLDLSVRNGHAMHNGYIVVAVDWRNEGQLDYRYSATEHRVVIDALYESMRQFSVDSDRVFLAGHGTGGDAAYDIAISHPEHFAGVLGFSGKFDRYVQKYDDNQHVGLPIYCVLGEKDFGTKQVMESLLDQWLRSKKYNRLTLVEYLGRPNEYFIEDVPEAFKWMRGQTRRWPDERGFEFECKTIRSTDCYFWFFELDGIPAINDVKPALFTRTEKFNTLTISAKMRDKNLFYLEPQSLRIENEATLWLSPEFFDFSKNLVIRGRGDFDGPIEPSTRTLLDDVLRRADPQHAYWAAVRMVNGQWQVR